MTAPRCHHRGCAAPAVATIHTWPVCGLHVAVVNKWCEHAGCTTGNPTFTERPTR